MTFIGCASRISALYDTYHYVEDLKNSGVRIFAGFDIEDFISGVNMEIGKLIKIMERGVFDD